MKSYLMYLWVNTKVKCNIARNSVSKGLTTCMETFMMPFEWMWRKLKKVYYFAKESRKEITIFLHITLGVSLLIWGVEIFSLWRILLGLYILAWVGIPFLWYIFKTGIYLDAE